MRLDVTSSNSRNRARMKNRVTCDLRLVWGGLPGSFKKIFDFFDAGVDPPLVPVGITNRD
jgi:hypothetical protein